MKDKWEEFKKTKENILKEGVVNDEVGQEVKRKIKGSKIIIENKYHIGGEKYVFDQNGNFDVNLKVPIIPVKIKLNKKGISIDGDIDIKGWGVNANISIGKETSISTGLKIAKRDLKLKVGANEDGLGAEVTRKYEKALAGRKLAFDSEGISWNTISGYTLRGKDIERLSTLPYLSENPEQYIESATHTNKTTVKVGSIKWGYATAIVVAVFLAFNPEFIPVMLPAISKQAPALIAIGYLLSVDSLNCIS